MMIQKRKIGKVLLILLALLVLSILTGILALRGSLARLDGRHRLVGLEHPVVVTRDSLGVPDIVAGSRLDAARALGYLHGQDRFFQMDLQRRNAAGELAALLGPSLLSQDRDHRRHRFRRLADQIVQATESQEKEILTAYAAGVNAGLADLKVRPFEYLLLRKKPEPWRPADTILTLDAMFLDLSLSTADTERAWATVKDNLPAALADFLLPRGNLWEAPLQTGAVPGVQIPDSTDFDLRRWKYNGRTYEQFRHEREAVPRQDLAGSNNWAVAGSLTGHGGALLANDMHLGFGLPNIWYRARMSWPQAGGRRSVVGVTLPGTPALVAGSNGRVAWGFTNSYGDWVDLVVLDRDPADSTRYRTPAGWRTLRSVDEVIEVSGAPSDTLEVIESIWGPVWATDTRGRSLVLRWTAHDTAAVNLNLRHLESADDVEAVLAQAGRLGMPQQNLICADDRGHIAWTIAGPIPNRVGWDGRLPVSWADGCCRWDGYLDPARQPSIVDPAEGRLWSANNRVTSGEDLRLIGDGGYGLGARARQIRDDLRALDHPVEKDMLAVQLDDRSVFMDLWRELLLGTLQRHPPEPGTGRALCLEQVRDHWSGRASIESVAYELVFDFSFNCVDLVYETLIKNLYGKDPDFQVWELPYRLALTWRVLASRPPNLLPPMFDDWDDLILSAVDWTMKPVVESGRPLTDFAWGERNRVRVVHPFVHVMPKLARWLAAPADPLPGGSFMPRVQHRSSGASERLVVSPGREESGLFHMPGGQSGHPWSPYFLAGHEAWAEGRATPLLPGRPQHRLELLP